MLTLLLLLQVPTSLWSGLCAQTLPKPSPEVQALLREREQLRADLAKVFDSLQENAKIRQSHARTCDEYERTLKASLDLLQKKAEREPDSKQLRTAIRVCESDLEKNRTMRQELEDFCKNRETVMSVRATRLHDQLQSIERQLRLKK